MRGIPSWKKVAAAVGSVSTAALLFAVPEVVSASPVDVSPSTTLVSPSPQANQYFGSTVAVSSDGTTTVVGSKGTTPTGMVWASRNGSDLVAVTSADAGRFVTNVAVDADGSVIAVAHNWSYVDVYQLDPGATPPAYNHVQTITLSGTWMQNLAIDATGSTIVAGDPDTAYTVGADPTVRHGEVFVSTLSAGTYSAPLRLVCPPAQPYCSTWVAISDAGTRIAASGNGGIAYWDKGTGWVADSAAELIGRPAGTVWGITLHDDDHITAADSQAKLYRFDLTGAGWVSTIIASAVYSDTVAASADGTRVLAAVDDPSGSGLAVGVYDFGGTDWSQVAVLREPDAATDAFADTDMGTGFAIDAGGSTAVVGAPHAGGTYSNQGAAFVFDTTNLVPPGPTAPAAPVLTNAVPGDRAVDLEWDSPADGGSALTVATIAYSDDGGSTWSYMSTDTWANQATVSGLTNGVEYQFKVAATNSVGTGGYSGAMAATPVGPPAAPAIVSLDPGNGQVVVTWEPSADTGGSALEAFAVSYGAATTTVGSGTATSTTISGLTNGTAYQFRVAAYNGVGWSAYSGPVSATPRTVPGPPGAPSGTGGNGQVELTWSPPADNGGAPVDGYTISHSPDGSVWETQPAAASPATVPGLTNGVVYQFKVAAINAAGTGAASATTSVLPNSTAVNITSARQVKGQLTVAFSGAGTPAPAEYQCRTDQTSVWTPCSPGTGWQTKSPKAKTVFVQVRAEVGGVSTGWHGFSAPVTKK